MELKNSIKLNLKNLPGKRCKRKLVVFECDDWGGIRMPSKETYIEMHKANIPFANNIFNKCDTLADKQDLENLFEILLSVRDRNGHGAVMTPVTNVANPDFKKIKESNFNEYFYEPFTETLKRYNRDPDTFYTWEKGMELGIFIPELHGREHISVQFWLQKLREGNKAVCKAFEYEFIAVSIEGIHPVLDQFRPEFYFNSTEQVEFLKDSISEGSNLFKNIFGYTPRAFVPSNSIFHPAFEQKIADAGVKYLNVSHFNPVLDARGNLRMKYFRNGKKSPSGVRYYTRNCAFEPSSPGYQGIGQTLKQMGVAFQWGKPANISTHRVNFVGGIEKSNRDKGLTELKALLDSILKKWPDVEFISSADMFKVLYLND